MSKLFGQNDPKIAKYAEDVFKPVDPLLAEVRKNANKQGLPDIHVGSMDGLHLEVLTKAFNVKKAVEIGTLAGYSGINICRGLAEGGMLYTFEFSPKHAQVALENFRNAGFENKVKIFIGPALEKLKEIENLGPFDFVFIDADKASYSDYLDWSYKNLKTGGVLTADNTFAWGLIADEEQDKQVLAINKFNRAVASHPGFRATILPTGEGLTLAVKIK
ncbi:MAG: O-methyltransferase [Oligoflexia bacterium]|nr:O-methyltransferase [Oligoflexia bacterium]